MWKTLKFVYSTVCLEPNFTQICGSGHFLLHVYNALINKSEEICTNFRPWRK